MFLVLKKSSIKRTLALATMLILIGLSLAHPFKAQATESKLYYLYPYPSNNPPQSVLFWSESDPKMGAYTLPMWSKITDKQIVVGLPEGYKINAAMLGNNLGKYITAKIGNRIKGSSKSTVRQPRDTLSYKREISPDGIKEEVKVEIVDHFKNNDNFEKYLEIIKNNISELPDETPNPVEIPAPKNDAANAVMLGNTMILGGLALMALKLLPLLAL